MRGEASDLDGQQRKLLAQVVVELTRDAAAFGFLGCNQATRENGGLSVIRTEYCLALAQRTFGAAESDPRSRQHRASCIHIALLDTNTSGLISHIDCPMRRKPLLHRPCIALEQSNLPNR
jgi:hypothetical protein